jgi:hypothetical protein
MTKESRRNVQLHLREERKDFKLKLKIYLRKKMISQRYLCDSLNISDQEFHNILTGYQSSVKHAGILSYESFVEKVFDVLRINNL